MLDNFKLKQGVEVCHIRYKTCTGMNQIHTTLVLSGKPILKPELVCSSFLHLSFLSREPWDAVFLRQSILIPK